MMASQVQSILQALFDDEGFPTPDCAPCQEQLAAYVDAELAGAPAAVRFPVAAAHIGQCPACQQAYQELKVLLTLERSGELATPPLAAAFDFGYLPPRPAHPPAQPAGRSWRLDELGRLLIQWTAELLASLQGPALQPAMLKSAAPAGLRYELTDELDDLRVRIDAEPQRGDPTQWTVEVDVDIPSRGGWPHLAGSTVTLRRGDEMLDQQETDAFGKVVFEDVSVEALPQLSFTVEAA
jgi:hypothetical protein